MKLSKPILNILTTLKGFFNNNKRKNAVLILLLVFLHPLGLLLMFLYSNWKNWVKVLVYLPLMTLVLLVQLVAIGENIEKEQSAKSLNNSIRTDSNSSLTVSTEPTPVPLESLPLGTDLDCPVVEDIVYKKNSGYQSFVVDKALSNGIVVETGYNIDYVNKDGAETPRLIFVSPQGEKFSVSEKFMKYFSGGYRDFGNNAGRTCQDFALFENIPIHPNNGDVIYITAYSSLFTSPNYVDTTYTSKVYAYNVRTSELIKLFEYDDTEGIGFLHAIALDGSKLIFLRKNDFSSPNYCLKLWMGYKDYEYSYLELADIESGLKLYTPPQYKVEESERAFEKCLESM